MSRNPVDGMSRRQFLAKAAAATSTGALMSLAGPVIEKAYGAGPCSGHLSDIEHIVLLMQENRSFDHYFGTLSGTNGFGSGSPAFQQKGWNPQTQKIDNTATTIPYRFDVTRAPCSTVNASTTPTTAGPRCISRGTTAPRTNGCRRRSGTVRYRAISR